MSLQDLVHLAGVPGLGAACTIIQFTYQTAENVKVNRQQCKSANRRCVDLLLTLQDNSGNEGIMKEFLDEVEGTILRIRDKVEEWARWSTLKSVLQRGEIKDGLDSLNRDIDVCMMKFNIQAHLELNRVQRDLVAGQERDRQEFRETLQTLVKTHEDLKNILKTQSNDEVEGIMESLQTELHDPSLQPSQERTFRKSLRELHDQTNLMPPMADLTGQVTNISDRPVALGFHNDVYSGIWLDEEKVALRLPRTLENIPDVQRRFHREVAIWRRLRHPNILALYGIIRVGSDLYTVSPWMDCGNAIVHLRNNPEVDRIQILEQIAFGLEYLHSEKIVHGDLRGANVLISQDHIARLSDFGVSKLLEEISHGQSSTQNSNPRWTSPEVVRHSARISTSSDVWSFGMLCLELLTGERPFNYLPQDISVMYEVAEGKIPPRPTAGLLAASTGVGKGIWTLVLKCWATKPEHRPSVAEVKREIARLRETPDVTSDQEGPSPTILLHPIRRDTDPEPTRRGTLFSRSKRPSTADSSASICSSGSTGSTSRFPRMPFMKSKSQNDYPIIEEDAASTSQTVPTMVHGSRDPLRSAPLGAEYDRYSRTDVELATNRPRGNSNLLSRPLLPGTPLLPPVFASVPIELGTHFPRNFDQNSDVEPTPSPSIGSFSSEIPLHPLGPMLIDNSPVVRRGVDGSVVAGSVGGLIDRLLNNLPGELRKDMEYRDIFLISYSAFITADDFYGVLVRRFQDVDANLALSPKYRAEFKRNVIDVLKHWLATPHAQVPFHMLEEMKIFARSITSSQIMMDLAADVSETIEKRIDQQQELQLSPVLPAPGPIPSPTPHNLAVALTILEGSKYKAIFPADYITHLERSSVPNQVSAARETNNRIVYWVKQTILKPDQLERRTAVLRFFVNTALECKRLGNFASMSAIVDAVHSQPIARLRLTRSELSAEAMQLLVELGDLLEPKGNHRAYRTALSLFRGTAIPWIAVHLVDLNRVWRSEKSAVDIDGRELINFKRYTKFAYQMKRDLLQYKAPQLDEVPAAGALAFLHSGIRNIVVDSRTDQHLETRSLQLEAAEKKLHDSKSRELKSLGFRT